MLVYPIAIYKDEGSDYGVVVPDLPGCVSAGDSITDAIVEAHEAIYTHLQGMAMDGEVFPEASAVESFGALEEYNDVLTWGAVTIDLDKVSAEKDRYNVSLPKWLVAQIDAHAPDRSAFLAESAAHALQERYKADSA